MPVWLEVGSANDNDWRRGEDLDGLAQAEERARAMIVCGVVTPDGVRIVWSPHSHGMTRLSPVELSAWASIGRVLANERGKIAG